MNNAEAQALLSRFDHKRVLVVGDLMIDEYVWGHVSRVSPEAPVLVLEAARETFVPGGAANAARQLTTLGASVTVAGAVGDDAAGERLLAALAETGANVGAIVVAPDRPTTRKTRVVAGTTPQQAQQIVRVDREKRGPLSDTCAADLAARCVAALENGCDALLFSDYIKGVLGRDLVQTLTSEARRRGVVVTANPKPASARFYADVDVAQFNRSEADEVSRSHAFDADDLTFHEAGKQLRSALGIRNLLVTRGAQGLTLFDSHGGYTDTSAHRVEVFDGTGAGDSTIAGLTLALAAGATLAQAVEIGNAAGGAVVRKVGVVTATRDEIAALFG